MLYMMMMLVFCNTKPELIKSTIVNQHFIRVVKAWFVYSKMDHLEKLATAWADTEGL